MEIKSQLQNWWFSDFWRQSLHLILFGVITAKGLNTYELHTFEIFICRKHFSFWFTIMHCFVLILQRKLSMKSIKDKIFKLCKTQYMLQILKLIKLSCEIKWKKNATELIEPHLPGLLWNVNFKRWVYTQPQASLKNKNGFVFLFFVTQKWFNTSPW